MLVNTPVRHQCSESVPRTAGHTHMTHDTPHLVFGNLCQRLRLRDVGVVEVVWYHPECPQICDPVSLAQESLEVVWYHTQDRTG